MTERSVHGHAHHAYEGLVSMLPDYPVPQKNSPAALAATEPVTLPKADLHGSVSDPVLDTMNFLNEVTLRTTRRGARGTRPRLNA
ncbi:hypothetical protein P3T27_006086 [Kitasatospora sp. MAA19]|uniref:hypothetical protein n=1 Tax=unclassified Kitasatospora TaxID=2633591 RepID=UPI002476152C|nr:hypothetical protein [Kitasatospora sp. MAA19]MDH6709340.1 hypothetical protein [Kitasatospora sp. MAA19]